MQSIYRHSSWRERLLSVLQRRPKARRQRRHSATSAQLLENRLLLTPDLVASGFDAASDHVRFGQTDVEFEIRNAGTTDAGAFRSHVVWSPNPFFGDADDVVVPGSEVLTPALPAGGSRQQSIGLQLDRSALFAHAKAVTPPGLPVGTVSAELSHLFLVIDTQDAVAESNEFNNADRSHLLDGDEITYFPWDENGDGVVTPIDAVSTIQKIGRPDLQSDFDGNGVVTPLEALAVIQRIGYGRNIEAVDDQTRFLIEDGRFVYEELVPVELGQATGTRTIRIDIDTAFDLSDEGSAVEDTFAVYLVDPLDSSQTLLDRGTAGTAIFTLSGTRADFPAELVSFNGDTIEIDVTQLSGLTEGHLKLQTINSDADDGTSVQVTSIGSVTNADGIVGPVFNAGQATVPAGEELTLTGLTPSDTIDVVASNIRLNSATGDYTAEFQLQNSGIAIGREVAVVFESLPAGVTVLGASGADTSGNPYINFSTAIPSGGLTSQGHSSFIEVTFQNPTLSRFSIQPTVLVAGPNQAPTISDPGILTVTPGGHLLLQLDADDTDGDPLTFTYTADAPLPGALLGSDGFIEFRPEPSDIGSYSLTAFVSDGAVATELSLTVDVVADPITTTRLSGIVLDIDFEPLAGIPVELGTAHTTTDADGTFVLESVGAFDGDALLIHGEAHAGPEVYPFIAEKLPLLLYRDVIEDVDNVIARPIFLPALDVAGGTEIDPVQDTTVNQEVAPGETASVFVQAGTLEDQAGGMFNGTLSITEVPPGLTPAALPPDLSPALVVTIQPGEMVFTQPAPVTFPNRSGWAPGETMNLWSINPVTGEFEDVGDMQVSPDGTQINTITGGVNNSSWHFAAPPPPPPSPAENGDADANSNDRNSNRECRTCAGTATFTSDVEMHSGTVMESHSLATYQSQGVSRGITLTYDSLRADPRPIIHTGFTAVTMTDRDLFARLDVGGFSQSRRWEIADSGGNLDVAIQGDLRQQDTGVFDYFVTKGIGFESSRISCSGSLSGSPFNLNGFGSAVAASEDGPQHIHGGGHADFSCPVTREFVGTIVRNAGKLIHVNSIDSPLGAGWGLNGLRQLVLTTEGSALLVDGDGTELLYRLPEAFEDPLKNPPGDFSVLKGVPGGDYEHRTEDGTTYRYSGSGVVLSLVSIVDRNGNTTQYLYDGDGHIERIVDPTGLQTVFTYANGNLQSITDPANRQTTFEHDADGNLTRITDPDGTSRTFEYDSLHHLTGETDKRGNREQTLYGFHGRAIGAIRKDGTQLQIEPAAVRGLPHPLDSAPTAGIDDGAQATFVDANGRVTEYVLDQQEQIVSARDSIGPLPIVQRNGQNQVTARTDARRKGACQELQWGVLFLKVNVRHCGKCVNLRDVSEVRFSQRRLAWTRNSRNWKLGSPRF